MKLKSFSALALVALLAACSEKYEPQVASQEISQSVVPGSVADFSCDAKDRVYFDFDKSHLTETAKQTLARQAEWLKKYGHAVTVVGHCDERGTEAYNMALGMRRANAVMRQLIALGIPASKLETASEGKSNPVVVGSGEDVWAKNRVAISVLTGVPPANACMPETTSVTKQSSELSSESASEAPM